MVGFVAGLEGAQNVEGLLRVGFLDVHGLEPTGQRRVPLDVPAVFVQRGGADSLKLAPRQGGFKHIASVQATLAGAGANQGVHLVQEDDYLARWRRSPRQ